MGCELFRIVFKPFFSFCLPFYLPIRPSAEGSFRRSHPPAPRRPRPDGPRCDRCRLHARPPRSLSPVLTAHCHTPRCPWAALPSPPSESHKHSIRNSAPFGLGPVSGLRLPAGHGPEGHIAPSFRCTPRRRHQYNPPPPPIPPLLGYTHPPWPPPTSTPGRCIPREGIELPRPVDIVSRWGPVIRLYGLVQNSPSYTSLASGCATIRTTSRFLPDFLGFIKHPPPHGPRHSPLPSPLNPTCPPTSHDTPLLPAPRAYLPPPPPFPFLWPQGSPKGRNGTIGSSGVPTRITD